MLGDPIGELGHQLLHERPGVVDPFVRGSVQFLGFRRREAQFQEQVRGRLRDVADFGVDSRRLRFLALATAR